MIKPLIILWILLLAGSGLNAQEPIEDSVTSITQIITDGEQYEEVVEPVDTVVTVREIVISPDSVLAWKRRPEFKYIHSLDSILKISQQQKVKPQKRSSGSSASNQFLGGGFLKFLLWTLALVFVMFIVYQLSKSGRLFTAGRRDVQVLETPDEEALLLHHDFDELISAAKRKDDYRLATRYYFLKLLQQLRDKNLIVFEPDKTNSRYLRELPMNMQKAFSGIVLKYEFVWYGHYDIGWERFSGMEKEFKNFSQSI